MDTDTGSSCLYQLTVGSVNEKKRESKRIIPDSILGKYGTWVHSTQFLPQDPSSVKEGVGDGHKKVRKAAP